MRRAGEGSWVATGVSVALVRQANTTEAAAWDEAAEVEETSADGDDAELGEDTRGRRWACWRRRLDEVSRWSCCLTAWTSMMEKRRGRADAAEWAVVAVLRDEGELDV
jgi:hypothetical protein